ncbi:FAD-binding oxidoreductase [Neorhizobium sp. NCHU2750]|uniref:NAD(P)/FAD-dependent oxidoreductase n=1 Tax=Neorhizobium sp. NCHU2750 TaxID=1825976 RepID=UPI000E760F1D|nr:D-amino acid oxidase [Neorhizobium sp. NCHU2750]
MSPRVEAVNSDLALPEAVDVVIVGGGIIGSAAALFLAERGLSVALIEKGRIAGEQSSRNWGWCREQLRSLPEVPLALKSMALWRGMDERIGETSGFRQTGMMVVSVSEEEVGHWKKWMDDTAHYGMPGSILSAAQVKERLPLTSEKWIAAIESPVDGWAEPAVAAPAIARAAQRKGALIIQNCAVRGWETKAGKVSHVITEKGSIRTSQILVAGGAWSSMLLRHQGIAIPQSGVYATAFRTEASAEVHPGGVGSPLFSYRRRMDGGYTIGLRGRGRVELSPLGLLQWREFFPLFLRRKGEVSLSIGRSFFDGPFAWQRWRNDQRSPFENDRSRIYDPAPDDKLVDAGMEAFRKAYPVMANIGVAEKWGGLIDATPDMVPIISDVAGHPGIHIATGFSGHGFALGPGAGWLVASMIAGETPDVDASPFALSRFAEGRAHTAHRWV